MTGNGGGPATGGLQRRVLLLVLLPLVTVAGGLSLLHSLARLNDLDRALERRALAITHQLESACAHDIETGDMSGLRALLRTAVQEREVLAVSVRDSDGAALASAGATAREVRDEAGSMMDGEVTRDDPARDVMVVASPLREGHARALLGSIMVTVTRAGVRARRAQVLFTSLVILAAGLLAGWLLALRVSRRVVGPILALTVAVEHLRGGELGARVHLASSNEIGRLERGFNAMATALEAAHEDLAQQVATATSSLRTALADLEQRNQELRMAHEVALRASRSKSSLLAHASHEIRTPLNGVLGFCRLLLRSDLAPQQRRYAECARDSAERLLHLVNDLLDLARAEAGRLDLVEEEFDLRDWLDDTLAQVAPAALEKGLELAALVEPGTAARLRGDPHRLAQVLTNLLANAVKYTDTGQVCIRCYTQLPAQAQAQARARLVVRVEDTGTGIAPAHRRELFRAFTRAASQRAGGEEGSGLGLAISRHLVERMGGRISIGASAAGGTAVTFVVPLVLQQAAGPPRPHLQARNVLLCASRPLTRQALRLALAELGCSVHEAPPRSGTGRITLDAAVAVFGDARAAGALQEGPVHGIPVLGLLDPMPAVEVERLRRRCAAVLFTPARRRELAAALETLLREGGSPPREHTAATTATRLCAVRALVVDDDDLSRRCLRALLEDMGASVDTAHGVRDALRRLAKRSYTLLFTDLQLPDGDGTMLFERARAAGVSCPVVAVSADVRVQTRQRVLRHGLQGVLTKPVDDAALARLLGILAPRVVADSECRTPPPSVADGGNGDEAFAADLRRALLDELPGHVDALQRALAAGDRRGVAVTAHTLCGAAVYARAPALEEACRLLERQARVGEESTLAKASSGVLEAVRNLERGVSEGVRQGHASEV